MKIDAKRYYDELFRTAESEKKKLGKRIALIGTLRLMIFVGVCFGCWLAWGVTPIFMSVLIFGATLFLWMVKVHERVFVLREIADAKIKIATDNIKRLNLDLSGAAGGLKYIDTRHQYSYDLDIFGAGSIFSLLDTTCTTTGGDKLAGWLAEPLSVSGNIDERQDAVKELCESPDLRTIFRANGMVSNSASSKETFDSLPDYRLPMILRALIIIFPIVLMALIVLTVIDIVPSSAVGMLFTVGIIIAGIGAKRTSMLHKKLQDTVDSISSLYRLIKIIEDTSFSSPLLNSLREQLSTDTVSASVATKRLGKIIANLDQRYNAISFLLLNGLMLWDYRQINAAAHWIQKFGSSLPKWQEALSQLDALSALATFSFNNPHYIFPEEDKSGKVIMCARQVGHPLISADRCVRNDVAEMGNGTFQVITGANMAGKSTYLRTVGVNYLLAMIAAPVCADKMTFTPVAMLTGLRTTDSLQENESYFFAELQRLQSIINRAERGERMMVILDEILKGTNSTDKQKGSLALVEKLVTMKVGGIIATHDLTLGTLADRFPQNITNYRFEATITDDTLTFSYRIAPGIAQNMNACFLMHKMGII